MPKISELISLPVYSIHERKCIGHIENVLLNTKKVKFFVIYNEDDDTNMLLSPNRIYGISNQALTIKNLGAVTLMQNEDKALEILSNPINTLAISTQGQVYGKIKDVEIQDYAISSFVCDKDVLPSEILYTNNTITMIRSNPKERVSSFSIKKPIKTDSERIVSIQNIAPLREVVSNNMLIGRKATQDITGLNGEIIVKANSIITSKTLDKIKYSGKLKELTMHSK